jgi:cytochrome d ubiquinol oxidase subunit I
VYASWLSFKNKLFEKRWLMWVFVWAVLAPQIANQTGWFAAEMGRQPWVVYGLLRTSDALSKTVTANQVVFSLVMFTLVYSLLLVLFLYLLNKKIQHGPVDYGTKEDIEEGSKRDNPILDHHK